MCTAMTYETKGFYFGRNLDNMESYGEEVVVTPRRFPLKFRRAGTLEEHHAIIGVATVMDGEPLYYDAVNEAGLCMAGLNFPGNAVYGDCMDGCDDIAHFEMITWVLGQCSDLSGARRLLRRLNIVKDTFNEATPAAPLHWIVSDRSGSVVVEQTKDGLDVYDNPAGILTNNPPFPMQMAGLNRYMGLTPEDPENLMAPALSLTAGSHGMGALGLPGDLSSESRFARAVFMKENSISGSSEEESVSQFFHILDTVAFPNGCCELPDGRFEKTIYSSCCSVDKGIYYYTTYGNRQITAVDMDTAGRDGRELVRYDMGDSQQILYRR